MFLIPIGVAKKIELIQTKFLWNGGLDRKRLHLVSWEKVCLSKNNGGLGLGRVLDRNRALLAKYKLPMGSLLLKLEGVRYSFPFAERIMQVINK